MTVFSTPRLAMLLAAPVLALVLPLVAHGAPQPGATPVNTFIGTQDEGNTFPGASAPFGMIQVGPTGEHYAGWRYSDARIRGFGHSYLSGAGCWEQGGQLPVLPVTGRIGPGGDFDTAKADTFDYKKYAAAYSHDGEVGQAGYYKVQLTSYGGITAEATALTRAAAERYTFAAGAGTGHVLLNLGQANERHSVVGSEVRVVDDRTVEGRITTKSFCGGAQYATWFRLEFDQPFVAHGIWDDRGGWPNANGPSQQGDSRPHGVWLTFDLERGRAVTAVSAISHVDAEGARANLRAEGVAGGRLLAFDAMREKAQAAWQRELGSVSASRAAARTTARCSTRRCTTRCCSRSRAATPTAATAATTTRSTRRRAGRTTSSSRCGTPTARRTSSWRCCVPSARATSRTRC
jgi:putative alpha-1,2-mannosidase